MIYFIKASQSGAIKIGTSNDPRGRFATLQTGSPEPLELIGVMPGQMDEERRLHAKFARYRIHGEWFKGAPELIAGIKKLLCDEDAVEIEDLVNIAWAELWEVRGQAEMGDGTGDFRLFCVRRERVGHPLPDWDAMLDAVYPGGRFFEIDMVLNVTCRQEHWPEDREVLREPLTSKVSLEWAADFACSDQLFPVLTVAQKQAMRTHPTTAFVVGTPVVHPQYGVGEVMAVGYLGADRKARVSFVVGGEKVFVLERSHLKAATQAMLDAAREAARPPEPQPDLWQPRWMNPSNS